MSDPQPFIFASPVEQPAQPYRLVHPYIQPYQPARDYTITGASVTVIFCEEHRPMHVSQNTIWREFIQFFETAGPCPNCRAGYTVEGEVGSDVSAP